MRAHIAVLAATTALACVVVPAAAQQAQVVGTSEWAMPAQYKDIQAQALRSARRLLLAMVDSMPERLYRDRAAPAQRDFAQQIGFAAGEAYRIGAFSAGISQ